MRTNYKRITNVLINNFSEIELIKSPSRGVVAIFNAGLEDEQRVRVVLVDGRERESEQGVHMFQIQKDEFETRLVSAIEAALKDNFPTVWVHQKSKPSEERRQRLISSVKSWTQEPRVELRSALGRLDCDLDETLETMTEDQLQVLLKFISGIFQSSAGKTREYWAPKFHALRRALESRGVSSIDAHDIADGRAE